MSNPHEQAVAEAAWLHALEMGADPESASVAADEAVARYQEDCASTETEE